MCVLVENRSNGDRSSTDIYMLGGTQQELLDYYADLKGRPATGIRKVGKDGLEHLLFDEDEAGVSMISQYVVGVEEIVEP